MSEQPVIEVAHLTRRYGNFIAVNDVSFEVARGEIFGYLGANGAGKTTTIRMLCALLEPSGGRATVAGLDVASQPREVKRGIGYMSQRFSLYMDLTVEENLAFYAGAYGLRGARRQERIERSLEHAGLQDRRGMMTRNLPGGIRQRLALASSLIHEPTIVFLDEPTAGVDPASRRSFWRIIRQLARSGTTVFVTTHHLDEAEYCNRVGLMVDGRLVALDTPVGLKRTYAPGTTLAVAARAGAMDAARVRSALSGAEGVRDVQPFGNRTRVRIEGPLAEGSRLSSFLASHGLADAVIEPAEATLEDVFLAVVGANGKAGAKP